MKDKEVQYNIFENNNVNRNSNRDLWVTSLKNHINNNNLVVAEVGVSRGVNAKRIIDLLNPKKLYLIDPWIHKNDPDLPAHKYMKEFVYDKFEKIESVNIIEDFSVNASEKFPDETFDFVYIDALHDYDSVLEDFNCWFPKVKRGGIIGGHDYIQVYDNFLFSLQNFFGCSDYLLYQVAERAFQCGLVKAVDDFRQNNSKLIDYFISNPIYTLDLIGHDGPSDFLIKKHGNTVVIPALSLRNWPFVK